MTDEHEERKVRASVILRTSKAFTGHIEDQYAEPVPITGDILKLNKEMNYEVYGGVYAVRFSNTKDVIALGNANGSVNVLNLETDEELYQLQAPSDKNVPILSIRFLPRRDSDTFYATGPLGAVYVSKISEKSFAAAAIEKTNETLAMDINGIGTRLATAGNDLNIRIYDTNTMKISICYDSDAMNKNIIGGGVFGHTLRIQALKYHPTNPDLLISGGWDKMMKIWDRRFANGLVRTIVGPYIYGDGIDVKDRIIATASWISKGGLQLWDMQSGNLIETIPLSIEPTQAEHLYFCQYCTDSSDCTYLLTGGSGARNVQAVNLATREICGVLQFDNAVTTAHNVGGLLIAGSSSGMVKVANIEHELTKKMSLPSFVTTKSYTSKSIAPAKDEEESGTSSIR